MALTMTSFVASLAFLMMGVESGNGAEAAGAAVGVAVGVFVTVGVTVGVGVTVAVGVCVGVKVGVTVGVCVDVGVVVGVGVGLTRAHLTTGVGSAVNMAAIWSNRLGLSEIASE